MGKSNTNSRLGCCWFGCRKKRFVTIVPILYAGLLGVIVISTGGSTTTTPSFLFAPTHRHRHFSRTLVPTTLSTTTNPKAGRCNTGNGKKSSVYSSSSRQTSSCQMQNPGDFGSSETAFDSFEDSNKPTVQHHSVNQDENDGLELMSIAVRELQNLQKSQDSIQLILKSHLNNNATNTEQDHMLRSINSLIFQAQPSGDIVLVILPDQYQVDTSKLRLAILREEEKNPSTQSTTTSVHLVPSDQVRRVCGYEPGTVPPVGLIPPPFLTFLDSRLIQINNDEGENRVIGGGGHPDWRCIVSVELLLQQPDVQVVDVIKSVASSSSTLHSLVPKVNGDNTAATTERIDQRIIPKPFFPLSPPPLYWAQKVIENPAMANPLQNELVTLVGRITGVRRMAKQLVFCDLGPPLVKSATASSLHDKIEDDFDDYPWRSGLDGQDMAVQLIAGKTLFQQAEGTSALQKLKPGLLVLVDARTNVQGRESLSNWITKRSFDLVVESYQILLDDQPRKKESRLSLLNEGFNDEKLPRQMKSKEPSTVNNLHAASLSSNYTILQLVDILGEPKVTMVDDLESVNHFAHCLSHVLLSLTTMNEKAAEIPEASNAATCRVGWIGIDCEWKPNFYVEDRNEPQPVLLLQVYVQPLNHIFLFDLQSLLRPLCAPTEPMTTLELAVSEAFTDLWLSTRLLKCGFQLVADLRRIAASYPHIPAFQQINAVVEVSSLAKRVLHMTGQRNSRYWTTSLARLTEYFLKKTLNKQQQVSDWSRRPLTQEQVEYAALDAAVAPRLVQSALNDIEAAVDYNESDMFVPRLSRWQGDDALASCIYSWRFLFLETEDSSAIRKLRAKPIVGDRLVMTQSWITGRVAPDAPTAPVNDEPFIDVHGAVRIPARSVSIRQPVLTSILPSLIGQWVAKSKERCLRTVLHGTGALPQGSSLEFSQRSGYVEFEDGVALFVNMPDKRNGQRQQRTYPNMWMDNGRILMWYLRERDWEDGQSKLALKLTGWPDHETVTTLEPLVLLFVRVGRDPFLCCGRCKVLGPKPAEPLMATAFKGASDSVDGWGLVQLKLCLLDSPSLSESDAFRSMVGL